MNRFFIHCFLMALAHVMLPGCGTESPSPPEHIDATPQRPVVVTTSYPLYVMASSLCGDDFVVSFPAAEDATPRYWKPTAEQIQDLQTAALILRNGAGYEPWAQMLSLPRSRTVNTSDSYSDALLSLNTSVTHQHGPRGDESETSLAWATWLDPILAKNQLRAVQAWLRTLQPALATAIDSRADDFDAQLDTLLNQMRLLEAETPKDLTVLSDEPFHTYLAARMKWTVHVCPVSESEQGHTATAFATAVKTIQPDLLIYHLHTKDEIASLFRKSSVPSAGIDLCEFEDSGASLIERLQSNLDAIKAAVGTLHQTTAP